MEIHIIDLMTPYIVHNQREELSVKSYFIQYENKIKSSSLNAVEKFCNIIDSFKRVIGILVNLHIYTVVRD